jgi:hypothetical protein
MTTPQQEAMRAYVNTLAAAINDRPHDSSHLTRIATALPSMLLLAPKIGPWPLYPPCGPLDPGV